MSGRSRTTVPFRIQVLLLVQIAPISTEFPKQTELAVLCAGVVDATTVGVGDGMVTVVEGGVVVVGEGVLVGAADEVGGSVTGASCSRILTSSEF